MAESDVAPNLVIEDDGVQHFTREKELHVLVPDAGVFRITPTPGWRPHMGNGASLGAVEFQVAFSPDPKPIFYATIAGGSTLAEALQGAAEGGTRGEAIRKGAGWYRDLAKRVEPWLPL